MLEIISNSAAAPTGEDGEVEVDIDALDNVTLLELEEYANSVLDVSVQIASFEESPQAALSIRCLATAAPLLPCRIGTFQLVPQ